MPGVLPAGSETESVSWTSCASWDRTSGSLEVFVVVVMSKAKERAGGRHRVPNFKYRGPLT